MKLIGITGKSGAGKTTFSNMLSKYPDVGVIHLDDLINEVKAKNYKSAMGILMEKDSKNDKVMLKPGLKEKILKNQILFDIFMRVRSLLVEKSLEKEINRLQKSGKTTILLDAALLKNYKCYKNLSFMILLKRPYVDRKKALMERDGLSKKEIVRRDITNHRANRKKDLYKNRTIKIVNNNDKEELSKFADKIYEKHFASLKSKYKVNDIKPNKYLGIDKSKTKNRINSIGEK